MTKNQNADAEVLHKIADAFEKCLGHPLDKKACVAALRVAAENLRLIERCAHNTPPDDITYDILRELAEPGWLNDPAYLDECHAFASRYARTWQNRPSFMDWLRRWADRLEKDAPLDLPVLARATRPAVMTVVTYKDKGKKPSTGTCFIVSPEGKAITNYHVIKNANRVIVTALDGTPYKVLKVMAEDAENDLAVLKLDAKDLPTLTLGGNENVEVGSSIAVIGSPLGLEGTLSEGIVSGVREMGTHRVRWLQISAPISPGSSGSPVLNAAGEVIGIAKSSTKKGQALNFAIPVESAKRLLAKAESMEKESTK